MMFMENRRNPKSDIVCLVIENDFSGQRIDNYLIRFFKGVPKSFIYRMVRVGKIRINDKRVKANYRLQFCDKLCFPRIRGNYQLSADKTKNSLGLQAPKYIMSLFEEKNKGNLPPFPVLYEDDFLLAIDKPSGAAVHGGSGINFGVIEKLRRFILNKGIRCTFLELVHRLDKETSGILLLAKKRSALLDLHRQIRDRIVIKKYLACAAGDCFAEQAKLVVRFPLKRYLNQSGERRVLVDFKNGQSSETLMLLKKKIGNFVLLEAELKTGRTHQIRVHLASLGAPIVGDDKYGDFELNKKLACSSNFGVEKMKGDRAFINRMFLHAYFFQFFHPEDGHIVTLTSVLPQECQKFLDTLENNGGICMES